MKRIAVLAGLLLVGALSLAMAQQQQPASLEISKVKDNLYMISGGGGNTAAFITDKGVVVVDTKLPNNGPGILDKIKSVTPKPVTMVINTSKVHTCQNSKLSASCLVNSVAARGIYRTSSIVAF